MRITSVRLRLALWNVGVLALVLAAFGAAIRYADEVSQAAFVDRELHRHASFVLDERFGPPGMPPLPDSPPPGGERMPPPDFFRHGHHRWGPGEGRPEGWGFGPGGPGGGPGGGPPPPIRFLPARFLDFAGRPLGPQDRSPAGTSGGPWDRAALVRAARGPEPEVYSTTTAAGEPIRVLSVAVRREGQKAGVLQVAAPLVGMYEELARLSGVLMTLFPLALLVAALGGMLLTERALRPVRQISQTAAKIGASDLSERLPVQGKDEFSELAATFNGMLGRLERAFTQLAQALDQQRRFTADASHELRTPLTIIKANTSLALEEERSNAEYRRALEAADRATDTTTRIVQDLLLLARGDAGQLRLEQRPLRVSEVLERAVEPFRNPAFAPIAIELPDPSLTVTGDAHHLLRLFTNLIENAVRYTPPDGRITLAASADIPSRDRVPPEERGRVMGANPSRDREGAVPNREEAVVLVQVRDTGEGIPPEHLPHVCERFYRVDAARTRRQGGTGLGLAICQSIVEAHHGSLAIESVVGSGTTVTVRLPAPGPPAGSDTAASRQKTASPAGAPLPLPRARGLS